MDGKNVIKELYGIKEYGKEYCEISRTETGSWELGKLHITHLLCITEYGEILYASAVGDYDPSEDDYLAVNSENELKDAIQEALDQTYLGIMADMDEETDEEKEEFTEYFKEAHERKIDDIAEELWNDLIDEIKRVEI